MIDSGMATEPKAKRKRPNKQRATRAASFMRMAKDLRVIGRNYRSKSKSIPQSPIEYGVSVEIAGFAHDLAEVFDAEAARLRAMP